MQYCLKCDRQQYRAAEVYVKSGHGDYILDFKILHRISLNFLCKMIRMQEVFFIHF